MNKIIIKNFGEITPEDLKLIGSSTKRNQSNKIGMFGSGWKYALAWFLRNEVGIEIYSGARKIDISTKTVQHRDNKVNVIMVDGVETSLTTEMGPKWTGWMALREVISNAIDEGEHEIDVKWNPEIKQMAGVTQIVIPSNNELANVMMKYEHYFSFERKTEFVYGGNRIFIKTEEDYMNVYRKGIRCFDGNIKKGLIDVDFDDIDINESRLATSWDISDELAAILSKHEVHKEVFLAVLKSGYVNELPGVPTEHMMNMIRNLYECGYNFHCAAMVAMAGQGVIKNNSVIVPNSWYVTLEKAGFIESIFEETDGDLKFYRTDAFSTKGIEYHLSAVRCKIEVSVGKFQYEHISVQVVDGKAYVSEKEEGNDLWLAARIIKELDVNDIVDLLK